MTDLPEILSYYEGTFVPPGCDSPSPRFISVAAFKSMLTQHTPAVLEFLDAVPRRSSGPLKPTWVDLRREDGSIGVGGVAGHAGDRERVDPQSGDGF